MADKETAFVLPEDATPGASAPVHFPGFPGVYEPGHAVAVSALGFASVADAREARDELASVLKETKAEPSKAQPLPRDNHLPNTAEAQEQVTAEAPPVDTEPAVAAEVEPAGAEG